MVRWQSNNYEQMEKDFQTNFFNSIVGFKSGFLAGTINARNVTNLAIYNSVVHIGSDPPLVGFILKPAHHTYQNIQETGHYTLNHIHHAFYKEAHQTSDPYPPQVSEFAMCNLSPEFSKIHPAPYVGESIIKIGLKLEEEHHIQRNRTILLVGRIIETILPETYLLDDGFIDLEQGGSITISGLDSYHRTHRLSRISPTKL